MLKIINDDIELEITPIEKKINTPEPSFYHEWLNMYVEFKSKGIQATTLWDCYVGELEDFQNSLITLQRDNITNEVTFSPMEGMITLIIGKVTEPYESYYLKLMISTEAHSTIFIQCTTGLDQTYIQEIIQGVRELITY